MAKLRDLVNRRKAVRNIRKITRTMELIATARFKKAMDRAAEAEAYTRKIAALAADLTKNAGDTSHPLLSVRPAKKTLLLVVCANRGLCGGYNGSILREAQAVLRKNKEAGIGQDTELSGKRAIAFFRYQGIAALQTYTQFEDKPSFDQVEELANRYIQMYTSGQIDRLEVAYMKFVTASRQVPVVETLLPLSSLGDSKSAATASAGGSVEYDFLPNAAEILESIVPVAFKQRLFKCFLDAAVSEQIARRVAMKAATENAADLIKEISRQYNRARQANITKEISELIAGSEALK
ncbi:ATP synthase F1 subunit gamma [Telmatocola sphagniphila]|uniref:ATP synthase gamma chain n=1 Tax=Telmatocola sphagniphila TaxID=1123043 RepID=A0A8E6B5V5_9BACT|nr:ATP synthase F1 subunit gamma [Telmatocola sphagniphila]QVL32296.1 ATP synthase F1 subunit gamma [Telmatocola sphagniphila]